MTSKRASTCSSHDLGGDVRLVSDPLWLTRERGQSRLRAWQRLAVTTSDEAIPEAVLDEGGPAGHRRHTWRRLLDECRRQKEGVGANTRRLVVDPRAPGPAPLVLPMEDVYAVCAPMIAKTIEADGRGDARSPARIQEEVGWNELAGIYVVGGASSFPLVSPAPRPLRPASRAPLAASVRGFTAIGLANFLDDEAG